MKRSGSDTQLLNSEFEVASSTTIIREAPHFFIFKFEFKLVNDIQKESLIVQRAYRPS